MQGEAFKDDAKHILKQVVAAMQDKKAKNIISLDLRKIADPFSHLFLHLGEGKDLHAIQI